MTPKQKSSYILDIKNIEIFYLPFWKEVKQIIITTILILIQLKSILSIKPNPSDIPKILTANDSTITNSLEIDMFSTIIFLLLFTN